MTNKENKSDLEEKSSPSLQNGFSTNRHYSCPTKQSVLTIIEDMPEREQ